MFSNQDSGFKPLSGALSCILRQDTLLLLEQGAGLAQW